MDELIGLDFYYLERWSIWLDVVILAQDDPGRHPRPRSVLTASMVPIHARPVRLALWRGGSRRINHLDDPLTIGFDVSRSP